MPPFFSKRILKLATIKEALKDTFYMLKIETAYTPADSDAYERALRFFISYLDTLYQQDLEIFTGTTFDDLNGELPVIAQAYMAVCTSFCKYVAPLMGVSITQDIMIAADAAENDMRSLWGAGVNMVYPGTLPIGSGNEEDGYCDDKFYPDCAPLVYTGDECDSDCAIDDNIVSNT